MRRLTRLSSVLIAALALAIVASACGSMNVKIPRSDANYKSDLAAANIFHEKCGGCHSLAVAGADGSGNNPRTYLAISGPNFNVRCERPAARVLYAIENGGFSGAYMPQNIIVGKQAEEVAMFVSHFAGTKAPIQPATTPCASQSMGKLPATLTGGVNLGHVSTTASSGETPGSKNAAAEANAQTNHNPNS